MNYLLYDIIQNNIRIPVLIRIVYIITYSYVLSYSRRIVLSKSTDTVNKCIQNIFSLVNREIKRVSIIVLFSLVFDNIPMS